MMILPILFTAAMIFTSLQAVAGDTAVLERTTSIIQAPFAPVEGGPRRWQVAGSEALSVHEAPSLDALITVLFDKDTVLNNLGCEVANQISWCSVETIRGEMRGYVLADYLQPAVGTDGTIPVGVDDSRTRARKGDFDARGQARCAQERGEEMGECSVEVARSGGGDAAVAARFSNGFKRMLYFTNGEFINADATMSGSGSDTDWHKQGRLHIIRVDDQQYEIGDDFVFGR